MKKILQSLFTPKATQTTAGALAEKFGLTLRGDKNTVVAGVAPIMDAAPGQLTFYSTEKTSETFKILPIETLKKTRATVIVLQSDQIKDAPAGATLLIAESPRGAMSKIIGEIYKEPARRGISKNATIERGVFFRDRKNVYVAANATIRRGAVIESGVEIESGACVGGHVIVGKNTTIGANAFIDNATTGADCVIHPNAVIGKDGFGFVRENGVNTRIPHAGRVVLGDRVSVGSCTCIDRGLMSDTKIGDGTKVDNLCQIAHGVIIGRECFLAAGVGIAGGAVIGDRVLVGGHTGIANKVIIGDDVSVGAASGIFQNVAAGARVMGSPAVGMMEYMRTVAWTRKQIKESKNEKRETKDDI
ncbi:MAG: UDP-3-O-(3-hydroxymyristoyl)glucosamine N-acyltransferase [Proteobacteria bacterium]|nr:UDP-3-O-(3-hydroxymyristoyl)glucosamine N-acyltransferase [Pseudomonadota bacterium]